MNRDIGRIGVIGAFVLAVGTPNRSAADAPDQTAIDPLRWGIDARFGLLFAQNGTGQMGLILGVGLNYAPIQPVAIGLGLEGTLGASGRESDCYYGGKCIYNYGAAVLFADLHPLPDFIVDPWVGAGLGFALVGSADYHSGTEPTQAALEAAASLGVNLQIGRLRVGPYGQAVTFTGRQTTSLGIGARAGFRW